MVLERSFVLLDRVGERTERRIWEQGILTWDDFLGTGRVSPFSKERKKAADLVLEEAKDAFDGGVADFFANRLPNREVWRLFPRFREEAVFLDIETTGLSRYSAITVVGLARGGEFRALVRGEDLTRRELASQLEGARMLVTFNGASFDLPMLMRHMDVPGLDLPHMDLRFTARRVGLSGGLKSIERQLDLARDREFAMMTGHDAVHLWRLWERGGNRRARDLLLRYNEADVTNLVDVADQVCERMTRDTFP